MRKRALFLGLAGLLAAGVAFAGAKMWVAPSGAPLKAEPKSAAATVRELSPGGEVEVTGREGRWSAVTLGSGESGWIYSGKLLDAKPEEVNAEGSFLGNVLSSKIQSDAGDTTRSIRGLSPEAEAYAASTGSPKEIREALDHVVALQPKAEEVEAFLKAGPIGEYAE